MLSLRFAMLGATPLIVGLNAGATDIRSLMICMLCRHYTVASWCRFCSAAPKEARSYMRRLCDSKEARSLQPAESQPQIVCLSETLSCHCGAIFSCERTLAAHQFKKHAIRPAVNRYADPSNACLICLTQFSNRWLLCHHLKQMDICLLNSVLRYPPNPTGVDEQVVQRELIYNASKLRAGYHMHKAIFPCFHLFGPLLPIIGQHGNIVPQSHRSHPRGPGKQCRAPPDFADFELPDDIRAGQEIITHISWIPDPLGVNS